MNLQSGEDHPSVRPEHNNKGIQTAAKKISGILCSRQTREVQNNYCDRFGWWISPAHLVMAVADGQGQIPEVAETAMTCIGTCHERPLDEMFATVDVQLRETHGVALAVAVIDLDGWCMSIASVGNIRTVLLKENKEYPLRNTSGIVGGGYGRLISETRTLSPGDVLALYADGLDAYFALRETLERAALSSIDMAGTVLDRWGRVGDDAAVLICRHEA
jgi:hypothetical protein